MGRGLFVPLVVISASLGWTVTSLSAGGLVKTDSASAPRHPVTLQTDASPKDVVADNGKDPAVWRTGQLCGANSVYLLLKLLLPEAPDYDAIRRKLPSKPDGTSIVDMKQVLGEYGIAADIMRASPEDLMSEARPVIAHWQQERDKPGHFVVVLDTSAGSMRIIDGTTGSISEIPRADFVKMWTGIVLVPRPRTGVWMWLGPLMGGMFFAVFAFSIVKGRMSDTRAAEIQHKESQAAC